MRSWRGLRILTGMFTQASYTLEDMLAFRQAVYADCLTARSDALFELGDAVLTTPQITSPVALSLSPCFRRQWSSVFDALSDGELERAALRRVLFQTAPGDPQPLWVIDHTLWSRPDAKTVPDRGFYHQPNRVQGVKPIGIGHAYTTVGIVPEEAGSWCLPLDQRRISTAQKPVEAGATQLKELLAEVDFRPLVTGDSEYCCAPFLTEMDSSPCDLLLRVRPNRVLYGDPGPYSGKGRPKLHGKRFALREPETWGEPDQSWEGEDTTGRRMQVRAWENLHFKGAHKVTGTLILTEWPDAKGTRRDPKRLWLFWVGQQQPPLSQTPPLYGRRSTIEHFYRFEKKTLRWNRAQMLPLENSQRWTDLMTLVYWELWVARSLVQLSRLPWDRKPRKTPTPGQVRYNIGGLLARMGTPAHVPKPRGKSPGRQKGERPDPHPRYAVVKKTSKKGKKRTKRKTASPK